MRNKVAGKPVDSIFKENALNSSTKMHACICIVVCGFPAKTKITFPVLGTTD